ncbi:hypothetical protein FQN60_002719 [Etheostoma spectabile]|nr:hypothetical protein FQN60_002719 [Etheostoma spectabile]
MLASSSRVWWFFKIWTAWPINSLAVWTLLLFEDEVSVTAPLHF